MAAMTINIPKDLAEHVEAITAHAKISADRFAKEAFERYIEELEDQQDLKDATRVLKDTGDEVISWKQAKTELNF